MRSLLFLLIAGLLTNAAISHADETSGSAAFQGLRGADAFIKQVSGALTGSKAGCVADVYLQNLQPDQYKSEGHMRVGNMGIMNARRGLLEKSPCLATLTKRFYRKLAAVDQKWKIPSRPLMSERAGEGSYRGLVPGWVWKEAMKTAGDDPNVAMSLVSYCLHDDLSGAFVGKMMVDEDELAERDAEIKKLEEKLIEAPAAIKAGLQKELDDARAFLAKVRERPRGFHDGSFRCGGYETAAMVPGSLSADADLSDDAKEGLAVVQAAVSPNWTPPAKYYHVYQGAALGCRLSTCGLSENEAALVQGQFAAGYRGIRLCEILRKANQNRETAEYALRMSFEDKAAVEKFLTELEGAKSISALEETHLRLRDAFPYKRDDIEGFRQRVYEGLSYYDAATLFRENRRVPNDKVPCSFENYAGPRTTDVAHPFRGSLIDRTLYGNGCRKRSWSQDRCDRAIRRLTSWEADEAWTRAEQVAGVRFGTRVCGKTPKKEDELEALACRELNKSSGAGSDFSNDDLRTAPPASSDAR